jgi:hypothetical protein
VSESGTKRVTKRANPAGHSQAKISKWFERTRPTHLNCRLSSLILSFYIVVAKITRATAPKQAVPKRDEKPIHGLVSDKNFIVANAVENILAGK